MVLKSTVTHEWLMALNKWSQTLNLNQVMKEKYVEVTLLN